MYITKPIILKPKKLVYRGTFPGNHIIDLTFWLCILECLLYNLLSPVIFFNTFSSPPSLSPVLFLFCLLSDSCEKILFSFFPFFFFFLSFLCNSLLQSNENNCSHSWSLPLPSMGSFLFSPHILLHMTAILSNLIWSSFVSDNTHKHIKYTVHIEFLLMMKLHQNQCIYFPANYLYTRSVFDTGTRPVKNC